ncbi:MAG TPA: YCF48-related protein, partial [Arachidicoccus sp.]|nr:YCF48-related protein [Arachidicoccus sp.]
MKNLILICILFQLSTIGFSQSGSLSILTSGGGDKTNLRGLSLYRSGIIWVSGSKGQIGKTLDGGRSWNWYHPKGHESRDFRDIQALDAQTAIAIAVDTPAVILKTTDGGLSWKTVYANRAKGMFLDALDFSDASNGIVVGDPIAADRTDKHIFLARTKDGGDHWSSDQLPAQKEKIDTGEAFFAASGSNIHLSADGSFLLVSGGSKSRLWSDHGVISGLPLMQGKATTGANGLAVYGKIVAVAGGDFMRSAAGDSSFAISRDGGKTWVN